jgi:hypothetical protein
VNLELIVRIRMSCVVFGDVMVAKECPAIPRDSGMEKPPIQTGMFTIGRHLDIKPVRTFGVLERDPNRSVVRVVAYLFYGTLHAERRGIASATGSCKQKQ